VSQKNFVGIAPRYIYTLCWRIAHFVCTQHFTLDFRSSARARDRVKNRI